jgi:hypothetical protein
MSAPDPKRTLEFAQLFDNSPIWEMSEVVFLAGCCYPKCLFGPEKSINAEAPICGVR